MDDFEESLAENPYSAPQHTALQPGSGDSSLSAPPLWRAIVVWGGMCAIGAAPSFMLALGVVNHPLRIPIMVLGVVLFAAFCITVDRSAVGPAIRRWPRLRAAVRTGYSLRIAASMLVPYGWMVDMYCGMISTQAMSILLGDLNASPLSIFFTVLLQGILLNLVILAVVPLIYGILLVCGSWKARTTDLPVSGG